MGRRTTGQPSPYADTLRSPARTTGRTPLPVSGYNREGVLGTGPDGRTEVQTYGELGGLIGLQEAFPVGSVYSNVTALDPHIELGYGTWQLFAVATGASLSLMEITVQ